MSLTHSFLLVLKDRFGFGAALLDTDLQRRAESVLAGTVESDLDFTTTRSQLVHACDG